MSNRPCDMPELAEVLFFQRRWRPIFGQRITSVHLATGKRVLREVDVVDLRAALAGGAILAGSTHGKQMCFRVRPGDGGLPGWLGVHLGMTGELYLRPAGHAAIAHEHFAVGTANGTAIFRDPRLFGRLHWCRGAEPPSWWRNLPPEVNDPAFTPERLETLLHRHRRAPLKAVLLNQAAFPGVGNWMADEILWRARLHPAALAGGLRPAWRRNLYASIREVATDALAMIAGLEHAPPAELNERVPEHWLFNHRWADGGLCPRTGRPLTRAPIGGRTTCWSPAWQTRGRPHS